MVVLGKFSKNEHVTSVYTGFKSSESYVQSFNVHTY